MEIVRRGKERLVQPTPTTKILEYSMRTESISGAEAHIHGRYPETGFAVNTLCDEWVLVLKGSGRLIMPNENVEIWASDAIFLKKGEKFAWEGELILLIVTAPAFDSAQHQIVE